MIFFRPPDEIPRQIFTTMQQESNGNPINLNIGNTIFDSLFDCKRANDLLKFILFKAKSKHFLKNEIYLQNDQKN